MALALFDLDNTLLKGDSDHGFGEFLVEKALVDTEYYKQANDQFYCDYKKGTLDFQAYTRFALEPLSRHDMATLAALQEEFMRHKVEDMILPKALSLLQKHRDEGDTLLIITATNRFITEPIAKRLGVEHLLATEPEIKNARYTGNIIGIPCFQDGKVTRLEQWLEQHQESLDGSYFYSDSINDTPLLSKVSYPIAVDPCDRLREYALKNTIPIISLR